MKFLVLAFGLAFFFAVDAAYGAGRQLTGQHAPATTPALSPEEAQKKFIVPDGFEVRLFAAEPDVINPVAMTWDARGRLWVLELYEYPLGAPQGAKPRDRIKILEDIDGDGKADKVTIFADGLNLATGLVLGYGGAFVGQAPHLLFLKDTNGDDVADERQIVMTGFGLDDRHELLNGFTWGPDGYLYMTQGVFTQSKVKDPSRPDDDGVLLTAAVARFHPKTKKFEIFSEGTSNPWGVDFDATGNAFVSACVIDHFFHMAPGGLYVRQAGNPPNPYAYELLPSIVDHKHFMAAYAGVQIYQGDQYPAEYQGTAIMGNIHDSAVHQDKLTRQGSSFTASFMRDFVRANDGWFRPVSEQTGPDGAIWIMDWYDKYPCYQNANADPEGVDRERGRIWRVVYTGDRRGAPVPSRPQKEMNLTALTSEQLVDLLKHSNVWQRRMAQRILTERGEKAFGQSLHEDTPLHKLFASNANRDARLAALWTLHGMGDLLDDEWLDKAARDDEPAIRAWAARLTGERGYPTKAAIGRLEKLAEDKDVTVRVGVAVAARQFVSGALTIDTTPNIPVREVITGGILTELLKSSKGEDDRLLNFTYWMALEPIIAYDPIHALGFYPADGMKFMPLSGIVLTKIMRRICDLGDTAILNRALLELGKLKDTDGPVIVAALNGLIEGQRGAAVTPGGEAMTIISRFASLADKEVSSRARRLGAIWGDSDALRATIGIILDSRKPFEERIQAIQSARRQKTEPVRDALVKILAGDAPDNVVQTALSGLSEVGGDDLGEKIISNWKTYSPATRRSASEVLVSRKRWAQSFLNAVENKTIPATDIPAPIARNLAQSKDEAIRNRTLEVIGRFRESNPDKIKLIAEKKSMILAGSFDLKKGHEIAQKTCFTCHKLYGEGAEVGPDLTGVGRSSLDALLSNVIDPNQIVGKGYENVEIETRDGRNLSGRIIENTDSRIKLLSVGPKEEVLSKKDIESMRVSEMSVMPEGLEQMPDEDFRNLIMYIFNPPQEKKRSAAEPSRDARGQIAPFFGSPSDGESVALWNPEWKLDAPDFEESPRKLPEYLGKNNVLMTHPFDQERGAAFERVFQVPSAKRTLLSFNVAAHEKGDWELRVLVNGLLLKKQTIDQAAVSWKHVEIDLTSFAGKKVALRLENCANNWAWEFAYWNEIKIDITDGQRQASR